MILSRLAKQNRLRWYSKMRVIHHTTFIAFIILALSIAKTETGDLNFEEAYNVIEKETDFGNILFLQILDDGIWKYASSSLPCLDTKKFLDYLENSKLFFDYHGLMCMRQPNESKFYEDWVVKQRDPKNVEEDTVMDFLLRANIFDELLFQNIDTKSMLFMVVLQQFLCRDETTQGLIDKIAEKSYEAEKLKKEFEKNDRENKFSAFINKEAYKPKFVSRFVDLLHDTKRPTKIYRAIKIAKNPQDEQSNGLHGEIDILVKHEDIRKDMTYISEIVITVTRRFHNFKTNQSIGMADNTLVADLKLYVAKLQNLSVLTGLTSISNQRKRLDVTGGGRDSVHQRKSLPMAFVPSSYIHWKTGTSPGMFKDLLQNEINSTYDKLHVYNAVVAMVSSKLILDSKSAINFETPCGNPWFKENNKEICSKFFELLKEKTRKTVNANGKVLKSKVAETIIDWFSRAYDSLCNHLTQNPDFKSSLDIVKRRLLLWAENKKKYSDDGDSEIVINFG